MITNKTILMDTQELQKNLKKGDLEIPSVWTCIWPGIIIVMWMEVCAAINFFISASHSNIGSLRFLPFLFCFFMGLTLGVVIANGRRVFLSVPKVYRKNLETYAFFRLRLELYFCFFLYMTVFISIVSGLLGFPGFLFLVLLISVVAIMGWVMSVDFGRYQVYLLTDTIEILKGDEK